MVLLFLIVSIQRSSYPASICGNAARPVSVDPQPTGGDQLSPLLLFNDHQDPPPTEEARHSWKPLNQDGAVWTFVL